MSVRTKFLRMFLGVILCLAIMGQGAVLVQAAGSVPSASEMVLASSIASMASYEDELNLFVRSLMGQAGWQIQSYEHKVGRAEGRMRLFSKPEAFILAFPGTERRTDAALDLQIQRVPFGGTTPAEFEAKAKETADGQQPLVHQGFDAYTRAALFTQALPEAHGQTLGEEIAQHLRTHPDHVLYLTGHSLGGAAATLTAARLSDMGVAANQLQVITFGAPAVGNEAFARAYAPRMHLTRYVMDFDPVHAVLQSFSRNFAQFGDRVAWQKDAKTDRFTHAMTGYMDQAIRHYYADAQRTRLLLKGQPADGAGVLVAPVRFVLPQALQEDQPLMESVVQDSLTHSHANVHWMNTDSMHELVQQAGKLGCAYILRQQYTATRLRNSKEVQYRITLEDTLFDSEGNVLSMQQLSTTTYNLTHLEAIWYLQAQAREQRQQFLPVQ
ncbi:MAG: thioesterase domain-containing protein [Selenomonadaceae bacterium]|nr:thioesterase domain-containing protein [Selenomonadaceae bacterium]MDD7057097.1 thioesterase domain-containing protein [Selenomonadaceae bacterium]MDY3916985.1 thioesterase domain-containing protein [Selenomonadaceae bacterium]